MTGQFNFGSCIRPTGTIWIVVEYKSGWFSIEFRSIWFVACCSRNMKSEWKLFHATTVNCTWATLDLGWLFYSLWWISSGGRAKYRSFPVYSWISVNHFMECWCVSVDLLFTQVCFYYPLRIAASCIVMVILASWCYGAVAFAFVAHCLSLAQYSDRSRSSLTCSIFLIRTRSTSILRAAS